jgi:uncharacterized membrane protein YkvA (DUF1232 family)
MREMAQIVLALPRHVRLCWRLLGEARVGIWPKLVLLGALAYVVFPLDLLADTVPLLGQVDDLGVLLAASGWFVGACPPAVVEEHERALRG